MKMNGVYGAAMGTEPILEIKDLEVSFDDGDGKMVPAIRGISYSVGEEVLGIVGESGSGKSVSTACILRLLPPEGHITGGQILFEGKDLLRMSREEIAAIRGNRISMIFQDPMTSLDPLFSIGYQIEETLRKHTALNADERKARVIELLTMVGINQPEKRMCQYPHEFSGGMRQRAMIAMALACDPKLLIADEPTTALDVTIQAQILDLLKELKTRLHMSVIFITHDLGVVSDICDRIIVMYAGKIVEEGDKRQIFYNHMHPYTEGLLQSVPDIKQDRKTEMVPIEGNPPDMETINDDSCAFAPRCRYAMNICVKSCPENAEYESGHSAACWKCIKEYRESRGLL